MRPMLLAAIAALTFASATYAGTPHCGVREKLCDNTCVPTRMFCRRHSPHPECNLAKDKPCGFTCIPKHDSCHRP